jgi:hypothetical protein
MASCNECGKYVLGSLSEHRARRHKPWTTKFKRIKSNFNGIEVKKNAV